MGAAYDIGDYLLALQSGPFESRPLYSGVPEPIAENDPTSQIALVPAKRRALIIERRSEPLDFDDSSPSWTFDWIRDGEQAVQAITRGAYDVYLVDPSVGRHEQFELARTAGRVGCPSPVILLNDPAASGSEFSESLPPAPIESTDLRDPLTGLVGPGLFVDRISQASARAIRDPARAFAVVSLRLEGIASVRVAFGHEIADFVLIEIAARLDGRLRGSDTVARWRDHEFALILEDVRDRRAASEVCGELLDRIAAVVDTPVGPIEVTGRGGIAYCPPHGGTATDVLRSAQRARQAAHRCGLRFAYADDAPQAGIVPVFNLSTELGAAIERDEIFVEYQPIIDLRTGEVCAAEALARWIHPEHGVVSPTQFIGVAERAGLLPQLGARVLELACTAAAAWEGTNIAVHVNVSARQMLDPSFLDILEATLVRSGCPAERLVLELTELHPEQMEALQDCVRALRGGGIRVELDDFGSSVGLGHLLDLAVDGIKLEAGLVARCAQDSRALKLAAHMIEAAHDLGVRVTAENVENALAKPLLRGLACDRAQGFAFGRPRRVVRVEDILDS